MKILLIHNRFRLFTPLTWLSLAIRIFTCSKWNHIAIEHEGGIVESIRSGVTPKTKQDWLVHSDRIVLPLTVSDYADVDFSVYHGKPYGFIDLLVIAWYIMRVKWFGMELKRMPKNHSGFICSELAGVIINLENAHLVTPADFEYMQNLEKGEEYHTYRK